MAQASATSVSNTEESPVTRDYMTDVLRKYEENDSLIITDMSSERALSYGENFIAEVFRVKIDGEITKDEKSMEYSKSVIVKKPSRDDKNVPLEMFNFEPQVYNHVLVAFENVCNQKLPVIRCIQAEANVVITEDFKDGGWVLPKHRESLSQEQLAKAIKSLAVFHAASIVLSNSDKVSFKKLALHVQDQIFCESNAALCKKVLADSYAVAKYIADEYLPKANEAEAAAIKKIFSQTSDDMYNKAKQATLQTSETAQIYVHGDYWVNNFMLKEDNSGDYAMLLNFGRVCLASPARDLVYLFATNPEAAVNKPSLLQAYVEELHKQLKKHDMKSDVLAQFSMEFIKSEMERLKPVALLAVMWLLVPISYTSYPSIEEYNKTQQQDKTQLVVSHIDKEFYVRRLMEVLLEYV